LWDHAFRLFEEHPVIGIGFGGYEFTIREGRWTDTHNYYLKMLAEQGIIGFGLLILTLFLASRSGWRLLKAGKNGFDRGLGLGFMGCIVAAATTNLFGDRWSYFEMGSYFWVFWGLVDRAVLMSSGPADAGNEKMETKDESC
jgi:O-antigen ligase